jgi:hypothetical protein
MLWLRRVGISPAGRGFYHAVRACESKKSPIEQALAELCKKTCGSSWTVSDGPEREVIAVLAGTGVVNELVVPATPRTNLTSSIGS